MSSAFAVPTTASSHDEAVVGLHLGHAKEREAEHAGLEIAQALREHGVPVSWVATHRTVTDAGPAVSLAFAAGLDPSLLQEYLDEVVRGTGPHLVDADTTVRAAQARRALSDRIEGRVVVFPGQHSLDDVVTVEDILANTAIDEIAALGGHTATPEHRIVTRSFVRPRLTGGRVVLHVQPARDGTFVPFETPEPTPCCADHG